MRASRSFLVALPLALGCGGSNDGDRRSFSSAPPAEMGDTAATVTIDTSMTHQELVGFGAAAAYYTEQLAPRGGDGDDIYDVLFRELGLDILRIGNWFQNQSDTATATTELADRSIGTILQKASEVLGHQPKILMSSWSPPAYLKDTGQVQNVPGTLKKENGAFVYDQFASWWVASLQAYGERGIHPDYISIQNEPDYFNKDWATCFFNPIEDLEGGRAGYGQALDAVFRAVQVSEAINPKPQFVGAEPSGIGSNKFEDYLAGLDASQVFALAHHLYNGGGTARDPMPDSFLAAMRNVRKAASAAGKPVFMTEYSYEIPRLVNTAWLIHNSLVVEGVSAYVYWDLFWVPPSQGPLVSITGSASAEDKGYKVLDSYYSLKHYARWTDPGWTRVEAASSVNEVKVSAFVSPAGDSLTIVLANTDALAHSVTVDSGSFAFSLASAYRSSGDSERTAPIELGAGNVVEMPASSIVTVVLGR